MKIPALLFATGTIVTAQCEDHKPNIIFILADDLGYMDVCEFARHTLGTAIDSMFYETPNIDRMASEGMCFSSAYVSQLSSPTRAALLTGKYASRMGITTALPLRDTWYMLGMSAPKGGYIHDVVLHEDRIAIQQALINGKSNSAIPAGRDVDQGRKEIVIAEALEGYHTAFIGKWHVGGFGAEGYQPGDRGFDEVPAYYDRGASPYFDWQPKWDDKKKVRFPKMPQSRWETGDSGVPTGKPYLTDDITDRALDYIERRTEAGGDPFFLYISHFAVHSPLEAMQEDEEYYRSKPTRGWNGHYNPAYAGLIHRLDISVGRVFAKLEELGIADNTLIIFMSDNGGIEKRRNPRQNFTCNFPYTGEKAMLFEGGIKTPLIVWRKERIEKGEWCDVPVDMCDIFPTLLDAAGIDPEQHYERGIDGRSILPLLEDRYNSKQEYARYEFFWHYPYNVMISNPVDGFALTPHSAVRMGNMKLIFDWYGRLYLFDMAADPFEKQNIAGHMPEMTQKLFARLVAWLDMNVEPRYLPSENPLYDPAKESRDVPYVDLVSIYRAGGDITKVAAIPVMSGIKIK